MAVGREERREQRRERAVAQFGADAESALSALALLDAAWQGNYGEPTPPSGVTDDIWCVAKDLPALVPACWLAYLDFRDLRMWADDVRATT